MVLGWFWGVFRIVLGWFLDGFGMILGWFQHGFGLIFWLIFGWFWDDFWMILGWFWDDFSMIFRWFWDDFSMILGWFFDDYSMTFRWFFDHFSMILGWFFDEFSMIFRWISHDFPTIKRGSWVSGIGPPKSGTHPCKTAARLADTEGKKNPSPRTRTRATRPTSSQKEQASAEPLSQGTFWTTAMSFWQQTDLAVQIIARAIIYPPQLARCKQSILYHKL